MQNPTFQRIIRRNLPNAPISDVITGIIASAAAPLFLLIIQLFDISQVAKQIMSFALGIVCYLFIKFTITAYKSWRKRSENAETYVFLSEMSIEELTEFLEELTEKETSMRKQIEQENSDYRNARITLNKEHKAKHEQLSLAYNEEHFSTKRGIASDILKYRQRHPNK